ncbi:hypothetical protein BD410DRAFT_761201 [Rickenella mellea]|uniref:Large ribosomal subunit protein bL28c n=1 Tax=Rickenella mellea TaxID=50990 RepID=A0A4Y7QLI9_9AGAM|nr:hypothetical protein BD410DRAFT_761201 [Rickenella mellea]
MFPTLSTCLQLAPKIASQPFKRSQNGLYHGKTVLYGNNVPFSEHRTRRRWLPNIQRKTFWSEALGKDVRIKVSMCALRTIRKHGSFDKYLLLTKPELLGWEGMRLRISVREKWPDWQERLRKMEETKMPTMATSTSS